MVIPSKWARQANVAYRKGKFNGLVIIREPVIAENERVGLKTNYLLYQKGQG